MCGHLTTFLTYNKERLGLRPNPQERRGARGDWSAARHIPPNILEAPRERLELGRVARRRRLRRKRRQQRVDGGGRENVVARGRRRRRRRVGDAGEREELLRERRRRRRRRRRGRRGLARRERLGQRRDPPLGRITTFVGAAARAQRRVAPRAGRRRRRLSRVLPRRRVIKSRRAPPRALPAAF